MMAGVTGRSTHVAREIESVKQLIEPVLNLNYCNLEEIPEELLCNEYCRKKLQKLYLKRNCIKTLNADLDKFQALTFLYLHSNNLTELPHVVSLLPSLSSLDVSGNNIVTLTPSLCNMKNLTSLNFSSNKVALLPNELWKAPALQCLNVSSNELKSISVEIVHCQTLRTLQLDSNKLTFLPPQVTRLFNLEHLSVSGNQLSALPNDFSSIPKLRQLCADSNPGISHVPVSLAPLSWWGTLGVAGCSMLLEKGDIGVTKFIHECQIIPPLLELAARTLHCRLKEILHSSSTLLWLPRQLCSRLHLPSSLEEWLVPSGKCYRCRKPYFKHHCAVQVSGAYYVALTRGVCKPANLALSIDYCSQHCANVAGNAYS